MGTAGLSLFITLVQLVYFVWMRDGLHHAVPGKHDVAYDCGSERCPLVIQPTAMSLSIFANGTFITLLHDLGQRIETEHPKRVAKKERILWFLGLMTRL